MMSRERVYFSLGSNIGDREANIREALSRMDDAFGRSWTALSDMVETVSWGFEGQDFINAAVMYELDMEPVEVLGVCKDIERQMGRREVFETDENGARVYHDRIIDIDILLYGDRRVDTEVLKIPHPLMYEREFVMRPLRQIMPLQEGVDQD